MEREGIGNTMEDYTGIPLPYPRRTPDSHSIEKWSMKWVPEESGHEPLKLHFSMKWLGGLQRMNVKYHCNDLLAIK